MEKISRELVEQSLNIPNEMADAYLNYGLSKDELVSVGRLALIDASIRFKKNWKSPYQVGKKNVLSAFKLYASKWVHGYIVEELCYMAHPVSLTKMEFETVKKNHIHIDRVSMDEFEDMPQNTTEFDYGKLATDKKEQLNGMHKAMETLTKIERYVIEHHFGIDDKKKMSYKQMAEKFHCTIQNINNAQMRALRRMREYMENNNF